MHSNFFSFNLSFLFNIRVLLFNKISFMLRQVKEDPQRFSQDPDLVEGHFENPQMNPNPRQPTPEFLKKIYIERVGILENMKENKFLKDMEGLQFSQIFVRQLTVNVLDYDAESLLVQILYGNFKKKVSVLITQISINICLEEEGKGQYGSVFLYKDQETEYVFKAIDVVIKDGKLDLIKIYREFFMTSLASSLYAGPKILNFFKYDIAIINNKAWFSMERCQKLKSTMKNIEGELIQNIRSLHSVGFMHLDIKPENVGFSSKFNRVVFLDFGFSQLIEEPFGFKTLSKYCGTIAYCSQEMRSLYYLEGRKYVDLYYNDLVCLMRTLKEILGYKKIALIIAEKIKDEEENCLFLKNKGYKKIPTEFNFLTVMIRLKYYIFVKEIDPIIQIVQQNSSLCSSIFSILNNQYAKENIIQDARIKIMLAKLRSQLLQSSFRATQPDGYFMKILHSSERTNFCSNILSVYHILDLPKFKFTYFATNILELQKLFFILNPMSGYFPKQKSVDMLVSISSLRIKIIQKIYQFLGGAQTDIIFYQKVSAVTHYFYEKLGPLKNKEILMALRAMFILLYDPIFVELDLLLVQIAQQKIVRLLTGIEFQLLKRITMVPIKQKQKTNSEVFAAMLQLNQQQFVQYSKNCSEAVVLSILGYDNKNQIYQNCSNKQQVWKILHRIRSLSGETFQWQIYQRIQNIFQGSNNFQDQFMHKLYSLMYKRQKKQPIFTEKSDFAFFCKIYKKLQIHEQDAVNSMKLKRTVYKMLDISAKLGVTYPYFLFLEFSDHFRGIQNKVFAETQIFMSILNYLSAQRNHFDAFFYAQTLMKFLRLYFQRFGGFVTHSKESKEVSQKIVQIYEDFDSTNKKIYGINSTDDLALIQTLQVLILLLKTNQDSLILQKIDYLISQFPLNPSRQNQFSFGPFMFMIKHVFSCFQSKRDPSIDRFILELTNNCIKRQALWTFQIQYLYLQLPIAVYNRQQNYERSYQIIKLFIDKVKFNHPFFNMGYQWVCIKQSAFHFCRTAEIYFIEAKFNEMKKIPQSQVSAEEAYFQFFLFYRTYSILYLEKQCVIQQVLRFFRIFRSPHPFVKQTVMPTLFRALRKCKFYKSRRKELICLRRQQKYAILIESILKKNSKRTEIKIIVKKLSKKVAILDKF